MLSLSAEFLVAAAAVVNAVQPAALVLQAVCLSTTINTHSLNLIKLRNKIASLIKQSITSLTMGLKYNFISCFFYHH